MTRKEWLEEASVLIHDKCFREYWRLGFALITFEYPVDVQTDKWMAQCPDDMDADRWFDCCHTRWSNINPAMYGACRALGGPCVEIYINPIIHGSLHVLETLVHEMVHAAAGCRTGHHVNFLHTAAAVGLRGDPMHHFPNNKLHVKFLKIIQTLGPYPEN
jgi:hypothetical protein